MLRLSREKMRKMKKMKGQENSCAAILESGQRAKLRRSCMSAEMPSLGCTGCSRMF